MSISDYAYYFSSWVLAHKYLFIAAVTLFECVLVVMLSNRVIVTLMSTVSENNAVFVANALRNSVIMGLSVITISALQAASLLYLEPSAIVTPIEWSVIMATLVSAIVVNAGAWFLLWRIKRRQQFFQD